MNFELLKILQCRQINFWLFFVFVKIIIWMDGNAVRLIFGERKWGIMLKSYYVDRVEALTASKRHASSEGRS